MITRRRQVGMGRRELGVRWDAGGLYQVTRVHGTSLPRTGASLHHIIL